MKERVSNNIFLSTNTEVIDTISLQYPYQGQGYSPLMEAFGYLKAEQAIPFDREGRYICPIPTKQILNRHNWSQIRLLWDRKLNQPVIGKQYIDGDAPEITPEIIRYEAVIQARQAEEGAPNFFPAVYEYLPNEQTFIMEYLGEPYWSRVDVALRQKEKLEPHFLSNMIATASMAIEISNRHDLELVSHETNLRKFSALAGHFDLKPQNMFVNNQGYIKLADFGMAALNRYHGWGLGSTRYISAEQAYSLLSDIHAEQSKTLSELLRSYTFSHDSGLNQLLSAIKYSERYSHAINIYEMITQKAFVSNEENYVPMLALVYYQIETPKLSDRPVRVDTLLKALANYGIDEHMILLDEGKPTPAPKLILKRFETNTSGDPYERIYSATEFAAPIIKALRLAAG